MSDVPEIIPRVWANIQGDPALLDGLVFGEYDDFSSAVLEKLIELDLTRAIPVRLVLQLSRLETVEETFIFMQEVLRLPVISKWLDEQAGIDWKDDSCPDRDCAAPRKRLPSASSRRTVTRCHRGSASPCPDTSTVKQGQDLDAWRRPLSHTAGGRDGAVFGLFRLSFPDGERQHVTALRARPPRCTV